MRPLQAHPAAGIILASRALYSLFFASNRSSVYSLFYTHTGLGPFDHLPPPSPVPLVDVSTVMTDAAKLESGMTLGDRYELTEVIGEGSFGKIYRARQLNIDRDVAIKILPPQFAAIENMVERFRREARLASRLRHPNTITIHDYGRQDDLFFIVMEYLRGEDLADRIHRQRSLELSEALHIARQTLHSLQEAHELGIIHRDLKPENIFLTQMGDEKNFAKILDFGIAKLATHHPDTEPKDGRSLTVQGNTVGTPAYMSPEQAAGESVDAASDLYALGVILFEMVNGRAPFAKDRPMRTMRAHIFDPVPTFFNASLRNTEFESIVRKALAKDPEDRYRSAREFLDALKAPDLDTPGVGFVSLQSNGDGSALAESAEDSIPYAQVNTPVPASPNAITADDGLSTQPREPSSSDQIPFPTNSTSPPQRPAPPPTGFSASEGSATSSIITVLDEPDEDEVIVLTQKKDVPESDKKTPDDATERPQPSSEPLSLDTSPPPEESHQPLMAKNESSAMRATDDPSSEPQEWKWNEEVTTTDASGSQLLTDFAPIGGQRRYLTIAATLTVIVVVFFAIATMTGWFPVSS